MKRDDALLLLARNRLVYCLFCLLMLVSVATSTTTGAEIIDQIRELFYLSVEKSAHIEPAIALAQELGQSSDYTGVCDTYIGALTALKGKYAFLPIAKFRHVLKGLDLMDQGVSQSPDNLEARFVRGMTCFHLPFFFSRKDTAREDFAVIIERLELDFQKYNPKLMLNVANFLLENIELTPDELKTVNHIQTQLQNHES